MSGGSERRVCVITGSSSGVGAATALRFAQNGYDVVVHGARRIEAAEAVAAQCRAAGASVLVLQADVGDDAACRRVADAVRERWGHLDTLVNSAGMTTKFADAKNLEALALEDFEKTYRVNLVGPFQMCRALVPLMAGRANASIVNVSSMAAVLGTGSSIAYAASKGALNTLTLGLARALGPAIRVNAVLPGLIDGEWMRGALGDAFEARRQRYASRALLQDVLLPDDAARTAFWLAHEATKLTGQLIQLDAGFALG